MNTSTSEPAETWIEAWPFDVAARAVRFISFLHESTLATDVELEPAEAGRYRRVSVPPSIVMEALLTSAEFFPESVHSSLTGPLGVRLAAVEAAKPASTRTPAGPAVVPASAGAAPAPAEDRGDGNSSLLQAFEHLDEALGETRAAE